jgi:amino acid transporter
VAYREKTAWLTLVCMALAYSLYFTLILLRPAAPTLIDILWLFGTIAGTQAIVVIIGSIVLALRAKGENRRPADERDKAIARRGATSAYYVLMAGMILVGVVMPFGDPAPKIVNTALLALVIAEAVRLVIIVLSYRRGWHG